MAHWELMVRSESEVLERVIQAHANENKPLIFAFTGAPMPPGDTLEIVEPKDHPYFGLRMEVIREVQEEEYIETYGFPPEKDFDKLLCSLYEVRVD